MGANGKWILGAKWKIEECNGFLWVEPRRRVSMRRNWLRLCKCLIFLWGLLSGRSSTSTLYVMIANAVNEGKLVPEDIIFSLLSKRLEEGHLRSESGFILDGIPRTQFQAEILDQIADVHLVVNFKSVEDSSVKTSFGFHTCSHCGNSFDAGNSESSCLNPCLTSRTRHSQLNPSTTVDMGGSHANKLRVYNEQSKLEKYYRKQRKLIEFQVTGDPGETWRGTLSCIASPTHSCRQLLSKVDSMKWLLSGISFWLLPSENFRNIIAIFVI